MNMTPYEFAAAAPAMAERCLTAIHERDHLRTINATLLAALEEVVAEWSGDGCMADRNDTAGIQLARYAIKRAKEQS